MILNKTIKIVFALQVIVLVSSSCKEDGPVILDPPETYHFSRNGTPNVHFYDQTLALNMISGMKSMMLLGDAGEELENDVLLGLYANKDSLSNDPELSDTFISLEQLTQLQKRGPIQFIIFTGVEVSKRDTVANPGYGGSILRSNGSTINVNSFGHEFTQFLEKGLMGSVIFHQLFNEILTEEYLGDGVNNTGVSEDFGYTTLEHHWDEIIGYLGIPTNFPESLDDYDNRLWAKYVYERESLIGSLTSLKSALITGRTAIVNHDHQLMWQQMAIITEELEKVSIATAIHYINSAINDFDTGETGDLFHHLSEAVPFIEAMTYFPSPSLSADEIETVLYENLGENANFWTVSKEGLLEAKNTLKATYSELESVADIL